MELATELDLGPARAFGALLRENAEASRFYDGCTPEQRRSILLRLSGVRDMGAFVSGLSRAAL